MTAPFTVVFVSYRPLGRLPSRAPRPLGSQLLRSKS